jgi:hypothetical protein
MQLVLDQFQVVPGLHLSHLRKTTPQSLLNVFNFLTRPGNSEIYIVHTQMMTEVRTLMFRISTYHVMLVQIRQREDEEQDLDSDISEFAQQPSEPFCVTQTDGWWLIFLELFDISVYM